MVIEYFKIIYEKEQEQFEKSTRTITTNTTTIGYNEYLSVIENNVSYTLPTGSVSITTSKRAVSYYTYELELNESKRNIKLLNKSYVDEFETELKRLMS